MMLLDRVAFDAGEGQVLVEGAVTGTLRKLKFGDGILGWEGDENMQLLVDTSTGLYDVWTLDLNREPCLVVAQRPYADDRLIQDVIQADSRRFDVVGRVIEKVNKRDELEREARKAQVDEMADKLHFALMHDLGSQVGGLTKRIH